MIEFFILTALPVTVGVLHPKRLRSGKRFFVTKNRPICLSLISFVLQKSSIYNYQTNFRELLPNFYTQIAIEFQRNYKCDLIHCILFLFVCNDIHFV
ncbi:MAG: hypothetical protein LBP59_16665 [Planctomycetaceae bacterium]|nr:hypothetical protein [Planctomycetaceae bacterium]